MLTREVFDSGVVASAAITPIVVAVVSDSLDIVAGRRRAQAEPAEPATGSGEPPSRPVTRRRLPILGAILIGLLAFVIAAVALTVTEAATGSSITGSDDHTTYFGSNEGKPWNTGDELRSCFDSLEALGDCVDEVLQ